ncbi:unnamed protein product [Rhodiola kirilowii]
MGSCSERIDVNEGEESDYSVHQLVWYLRGSYKDQEYEMVERLLLKREETIRAEMEEEVAKWKLVGKTEDEIEKDVEKVKREARVEIRELRKDVELFELKNSEAEESLKKMEKECADLRQQNMHLRDEEKKLKQQMMVIEENAKERVKKLEKECEDLRNDNMNLRDEKKRDTELFKKLEQQLMVIEEDVNERVKKRDAEIFEKLKQQMMVIKEDAKERVKKLQRECEDLRNENMTLRDGKKRDAEIFEKLKQQMMVIEEDAKERVKKLERECEDLREQNLHLRDGKKRDAEMIEKLKQSMMEVEYNVNVRVKKLEKECEDLRNQNMNLRDGKKQAVEMFENLKERMKETEDDAKEKVKKLELEVELKDELRKKAEEDLKVSEMKFKELELKVLDMQKDIDLLRSLKAGDHGTGMEVENNHPAEAEVEVQASVRASSDQFQGGSEGCSVETVEKTIMEGVNPVSFVSTANVKQSDPLVTVSKDISVLGKPRAKHGLGNYIEIISSDDDDPSEQQSRSKDNADFSPDRLKVENKFPSESDHDSPEASVGLKRKCTSCINEDVTEALSSPPIGKDSSPHLLTQEGKKVRPNNEHSTPPSVAGIPDSVNSSQPKEVTRSQGICDDDDPWKKSLLEKVRKVMDEDSSGSSSENSDD